MAHQPQNLVATAVSTTEIDLSWDDVGTLEDETFDIERNSVIIEASWAGGTTYADTGLDPDTEYTYRVRAVGGIVPSPVTPPAAAVAARVSIFTPVVTGSAIASVTPTTVSAVVVVFVPTIETTTSTTTPTTVVGNAAILTPSIATESYSDSYALSYGGTGEVNANVTPSTVVTASAVLTPTITATTFAPTDVTGLAAWYDASDVSTLWQDTARTSTVTTDGQTIKGVTDKSGIGNHLAEATNGPTYKTAIQNGHSVARYDGANDTLSSNIVDIPSGYTMFAAALRTGTSGQANHRLTAGAGGGARAGEIHVQDASGKWVLFSTASTLLGTTTDTSAHIHIGVFNGASSNIRIDGGTGISGSLGTNALTQLYVGSYSDGSANWLGDVYEILIYDTALSVANINAVGNYLGTKWGVTWTAAS